MKGLSLRLCRVGAALGARATARTNGRIRGGRVIGQLYESGGLKELCWKLRKELEFV